ncbi:hypothetical protein Rsub_07333 [Raphidocelis subcapitata]|uniref:non-specific serine/threonine protein kinase n=1 Tax=Raphidocelis subcapitata TaxID=307507 RepID=A0A2V0PAC9_9CHLO|nr:hypothetical protein Rsub_07333 [Raphidocelis subcapitata]|eukprot:GBF94065.1 hypothetical protein Rsub_07333 [Raphidocelis subcapitata]
MALEPGDGDRASGVYADGPAAASIAAAAGAGSPRAAPPAAAPPAAAGAPAAAVDGQALLPRGYLLAGRYRIKGAIAAGGFGTVFRAVDSQSPGRPQVAIKLELRHTLPDGRRPISPATAQHIKSALRGARLRREWAAYERAGAVAPPGGVAEARRHGLPLVHAFGHAVLEGPRPAGASSGDDGGGGGSGSAASTSVAAPVPLHHAVWMALELLGSDCWAAREAGAAFSGAAAAADVAHAGRGALRALHHLHTCGVLHRDIKPENLMLGRAPAALPPTLAPQPVPPAPQKPAPLQPQPLPPRAGALPAAAQPQAASGPRPLRGALQLLSSAVAATLGASGGAGKAAAAAAAAAGATAACAAAPAAPAAAPPAAALAPVAAPAPRGDRPQPSGRQALLPPVLLVDLGLAALLEDGSSYARPTVFYGTRDHTSPNLLLLGAAGPLDDLFSLGSTLLELQLGSLPWTGPAEAAAEAAGKEGGEYGPRRLAAAAEAREASWQRALRRGRLPPWALAWHAYLSSLRPGDSIQYAYLDSILNTLSPPLPLVAPPPRGGGALRPLQLLAPPADGGAAAGRAGGAAPAAAAEGGGEKERAAPAAPAAPAAAAVAAAVAERGGGGVKRARDDACGAPRPKRVKAGAAADAGCAEE